MSRGGPGLKRRRKLERDKVKRICVDVHHDTYAKLSQMAGKHGFGKALDRLVKRLVQYERTSTLT